MQNIDFSTFPNNKISALTMFHLETIGCKSLNLEELLDKYEEVYAKIKNHDKELRATHNKGNVK